MHEREQEYIKYTQQMINKLCDGNSKILEKYGSRMQWGLPLHKGYSRTSMQLKDACRRLSEGVESITHWNYFTALLGAGNAVVSGDFTTHIKTETCPYREQSYHVYAAYLSGKPTCLEIRQINPTGKKLELRDLARESCFVWEDEIIYIESMKEHLFWKNRLDVIETTGSLTEAEKHLSDFFVRIHRSYIVNKRHVRSVKRFGVCMDNGETLQIPSKRYLEVKRQLMC